jgi:hypothetical protein
MVELIAPNGVRFQASDSDVPALLRFGCTKPEQKPAPKRRAPRKAQKTQDKQ